MIQYFLPSGVYQHVSRDLYFKLEYKQLSDRDIRIMFIGKFQFQTNNISSTEHPIDPKTENKKQLPLSISDKSQILLTVSQVLVMLIPNLLILTLICILFRLYPPVNR